MDFKVKDKRDMYGGQCLRSGAGGGDGGEVNDSQQSCVKTGISCSYLPAISYLLVKDPILISNPVAVRSETQGGHGVQETGCVWTNHSQLDLKS